MATNDATTSTPAGAGGSKWLDFYTLLDLPAGADEDALRKRIGERYADASANIDHRDISRRYYYQTMVERVLPQCRRVLLNPKWREQYNRQQALHQAHDPRAMDYVTFMAAMQNGDPDGAIADNGTAAPESLVDLSTGLSFSESVDLETLPENIRDEIRLARAVVECVESGSALDLLPSTSVKVTEGSSQQSAARPAATVPTIPDTGSAPSPEPQTARPVAGTSPSELNRRSARRRDDGSTTSNTPPAATPTETVIAEGVSVADAAPLTASQPASAAPQAAATPEPVVEEAAAGIPPAEPPGAMRQRNRAQTPPPPIEQIAAIETATAYAPEPTDTTSPPSHAARVASDEYIGGGGNGASERVAPGRATTQRADNAAPKPIIAESIPETDEPAPTRPTRAYRSRVSLDDEDGKGKKRVAKKGERVLTSTSINILVAIVAVMLTAFIMHFSDSSPGGRAPLIIHYASELQPFMEMARAEYQKTNEGTATEIVLQPLDSRAGMRHALGMDGVAPDVWIPSESLWSNRYNQVAKAQKRPFITVSSQIALSPIVLIARADRASSLISRFPSRNIPRWSDLRAAIMADAPGHFGLSDPKKSGSGAIARYFMAREWYKQNGQAWNDNAPGNPAFWQWVNGFEENISVSPQNTADMVKDLVLGTSGRYWWAIAYESDAIHWLGQGKAIEVFYLPSTNFAEHPFCHIERPGAPPETAAARVNFKRFLQSPAMQQALLKSGFRPTEIDLSGNSKDNPFTRADFKKRGIRISGFNTDERLNYRIINNLNVQWDKRYGS